jgi:predicted methyltransferase
MAAASAQPVANQIVEDCMTLRTVLMGIVLTGLVCVPVAFAADAKLTLLVAAPQRAAENKARDGARHPAASLEFWGLKSGQTVIEVFPGSGYWSEILAPYAKQTGGHYIAATGRSDQKLPDKFADKAVFGDISYTVFSKTSGPMGPPNSADLVLTARNIHDWLWTPGMAEKGMRDFYAVLKPGAILAVEDHRADPRPQIDDAHDGCRDRHHRSPGRKGRFQAGSKVRDQRQSQGHQGLPVWRVDSATYPPQRARWPTGQSCVRPHQI